MLTAPGVPVLNYAPDEVRETNELRTLNEPKKLDEATDWPETVEDGWNILVGSDKARLTGAVRRFEPKELQRRVFGDGKAAGRVAGMVSG